MLPDAAAAAKLPFLAGPTGGHRRLRSTLSLRGLTRCRPGRPALFYRSAGSLVLAAEEIASLLRTVLLGFESELRTRLPGYDAMPDGVKLALLDMIYNLGPGGLFNGFPRLIKAIEAGNWAQAAAGCFRHGPGAERNEWTREMFLQSVVPKVQASAESRIKNVGFGLLGLACGRLQPSAWEALGGLIKLAVVLCLCPSGVGPRRTLAQICCCKEQTTADSLREWTTKRPTHSILIARLD